MSDNLKDILSNEHPEIDQETMLLYLQDKLSPEQRHEVEKLMMQSEFEEDALDGLADFRDKEQLQYTVEALNRDLKQRTDKKKKRREKLKLPDQSTTIIAIIILMLLVALSYIVMMKMMKP